MFRSVRPKMTMDATPSTVSRAGFTFRRTYSLTSTAGRSLLSGIHMMAKSFGLSLSTVGGSSSAGSSRRARAILSRTSWAARSMSRSSSNSTLTTATPWEVVERSSRTPPIEFRYSSRTSVTSSSITSGLAPSRTAETVTLGKSMRGN